MNSSRSVTLLLLALVAGAILILNQQNYVPGQADKLNDGLDAFVDDVSLRVLGADGSPLYKMTSKHMKHYSGSGEIQLENPLLTITRPDGNKWHISAARGVSTADGNYVWLRGAVELTRPADNRQGSIKITSSDVLVKPVEELAETENKALIITDSYRLETIGLKADFKTNRLELRSRVRGKINGAG